HARSVQSRQILSSGRTGVWLNATLFTSDSGDQTSRPALSLTPTQDDKCRYPTLCPGWSSPLCSICGPMTAAVGYSVPQHAVGSGKSGREAAVPHPTEVTLETAKMRCKQESFFER